MKFCNLLRETAEGLPELAELSSAYKRLKKILREVATCNEDGNIDRSTELQALFISDVNSCVQYVNEGFIEKEEDFVIRFDILERVATDVHTLEDYQVTAQKFADFHGRLLLFMNTTMLTYVCILKIMKKYMKKTGHMVPSLRPQNIREMPIRSTEIISSILVRSEQCINSLMSRQGQLQSTATSAPPPPSSSSSSGRTFELGSEKKGALEQEKGSSYPQESSENALSLFDQTKLALRTWEQLKTTAVTPSTVLSDTISRITTASVSGSVSSTSSSVHSDVA